MAETSLPGGESAVPGSPFYLNLLEPWLKFIDETSTPLSGILGLPLVYSSWGKPIV